ncbi:pirin family protein [Mucilaginibacter sp. UR6-1]|uniref:pirin family protein n=1 Tax=Mucilaginibacter sp. UR6-1 TaxID=1435643 RepID=UPI001E38773E|nr:pirin family protein [Mucilaginibacter sp. UR6-1]MCC8407765.1 pirin family protein [Mucilaginibacter sp. UR6-1]
MKKQINFSTEGSLTSVGPLTISRVLPNRYAEKVGPFVFLDYVAPALKPHIDKRGMGAHPHRGIATLTYILQGEVEHFDSRGHRAKIHSGGAQWMKAGNGIVHDENFNYDREMDSRYIQGFQFWINLPAKNKAEEPAHVAVQAEEVPRKTLQSERGWIKVVVGQYEGLSSKIPDYAEQFLYHIHLEAGKYFSLSLAEGMEVAAFLTEGTVNLNGADAKAGELVVFDRHAGDIDISNTSGTAIDLLLFGGEEYKEPVVARGPFVLNSAKEIDLAYQDYHSGKYGSIEQGSYNY